MDPEELRRRQEPLKTRYRDEPASARVTLTVEGRLDGAAIACSVQSGEALVKAGMHPATGGTGQLACSGDMLLQALAACAGVTVRALATAMGLPLEGGRVLAEGDLDWRGTLAVDKQVPVGFTAFRLRFELRCDTDSANLTQLLKLTERYCVVYQTLSQGTPITVSLDILPEP